MTPGRPEYKAVLAARLQRHVERIRSVLQEQHSTRCHEAGACFSPSAGHPIDLLHPSLKLVPPAPTIHSFRKCQFLAHSEAAESTSGSPSSTIFLKHIYYQLYVLPPCKQWLSPYNFLKYFTLCRFF